MANGRQYGQEEIGFRKRWYEAHAERFESDVKRGAFEDWRPEFREEALKALPIRDRLSRHRDPERFRHEIQRWAMGADVGFKGFTGVMLFNSLVKHTGDLSLLVDLFLDGLAAPDNRAAAARKMDQLTQHIEAIKVGANPNQSSLAFALPYFWALDDPENWPVYWPSSRDFLKSSTGESFTGSPSEVYLHFRDMARELDEDIDRFARVTRWWNNSESHRTAFLDPVLVDRCRFAKDPDTVTPAALEINASALVAISKFLSQALREDVSGAVDLLPRLGKPGLNWRKGRPRADFWADWRVEKLSIGLRLWVNEQGAAIGIIPGKGKPGWIAEAHAAVVQAEVRGFRMLATRGSSFGDDVGLMGTAGSFIYGRWYEPEQLADLDLRSEVVDVATKAKPLLETLVRLRGEDPPPPPPPPPPTDPLAEAEARFRQDTGYPTEADRKHESARREFSRVLQPDNLVTADRPELRKVWAARYGHPGNQSTLNRSLSDADETEYERILKTIEFICWGPGDDAARIDRVLTDDDEYRVVGLGESVILKLLAICHPDRYLCVYPYAGPQGKLKMLRALDLPEPPGDAGPGQRQVMSNDLLKERLDPFFPNDPWGMQEFLYWYIDGSREWDSGDRARWAGSYREGRPGPVDRT